MKQEFSTLTYNLNTAFLLRTRATKEGYVHTIARVLTLGGLIKCEQIHQFIVFIINLQQKLIITLLLGKKAPNCSDWKTKLWIIVGLFCLDKGIFRRSETWNSLRPEG